MLEIGNLFGGLPLSFPKKIVAIVTYLMLVSLCSGFLVGSTQAQGVYSRVIIRADGSIDPPTAPLSRNGDTYTFTGDFEGGLVVERAGVVIDGAGHLLMGPYTGEQTLWGIGEGPNQTVTDELWSIGIDYPASSIGGLTIKNLNVKNFSIGTYVWSQNNALVANTFEQCIVGLLIAEDNIIIRGNRVLDNKRGVFFGVTVPGNIPLNVTMYENQFVNNLEQLSGCVCVDINTSEPKHTWDNGVVGNYWSDYTGMDGDGDGIGDSPYVIDPQNEDRFPLVQASVFPPPSDEQIHVAVYIAVAIVVMLVLVAVGLVVRRSRTRKL